MKTLYISDLGGMEAALLMFRAEPAYKHCSFLFVEGESDEKFWQGRISASQCCIVFKVNYQKNNQKITGKPAVIENILALNQANIAGCLGIVDDDFDSLFQRESHANICATESHDLETLLLRCSKVFKKLLAEFADSQRITAFEEKVAMTVQNYLLELALPFAQIEWLKQNCAPSLMLKELHKNETLLLRTEWRLSKDQLFSHVSNHFDITSLHAQQCHEKIANCDPWLLCNGHTMTDILALGFQYGVLNDNKQTTSERISSYLRAAIEHHEFYQTQLCRAIFDWQQNHRPYQILT